MALVTSLVVLFYCCVTANILTKLLQQCFLIFIVVPWLYLGNSQVSVYRTIGPTLVYSYVGPGRKPRRQVFLQQCGCRFFRDTVAVGFHSSILF